MFWESRHYPLPFLPPPQDKKPLVLQSFSKRQGYLCTLVPRAVVSLRSARAGRQSRPWAGGRDSCLSWQPGPALPEDQSIVLSLTSTSSLSEPPVLPAPYQDSLIAILSSAINLVFINERINKRDNLISDLLKTKLGILNKVYKVLWETSFTNNHDCSQSNPI